MPIVALALRRLGVALALTWPLAATGEVPLPPQPPDTPWPTRAWSEAAPDGAVDRAALRAASDALFAARGRAGLPDTRALLAVHRGRIVAERYAEGFRSTSRFRSWSMAKSVTQALVGILVRRGRLALDAPAPVPAWSGADDPRGRLTLRQLLWMTSGLDNADGGTSADAFAARLLFGDLSRDGARAAAAARLVHPPGTHWAYSTATSALLGDVVGRTVGGGRQGTLAFIQRELATPLGVTSLVPEFDAADNYLGGSSVWASARDWARLGYLYLRDGVWDGRRILPVGWVDFTRSVAPAENNGVFGAHFWVVGEPAEDQFRPLRRGLEGAFMMSGAAGQYVVIDPTRDLIVVRLGELHASDFPDVGRGVADVVEAFATLERP